jgi:DNA polymerase-3 subunit beta
MALTLTGKDLARIKRAFARIISAKTSHVSALAGVLFTPDNNDGAVLRVTNLEETLEFAVDSTVEHANLLPFEDFKALASRTQSSGEVTISFAKQEMSFDIRNPKALPFSYRTATEDPGEFPEPPEVEFNETVAYEGNDFALALKRVVPAACTEATRYVLNSVLFNGADQELVATDGRRLVCAKLPNRDARRSAIIPATKLLRKGLPSDDNLLLELAESHARVSAEDWTYTVKLVDGTYPNYKQVVPADADLPVQVELCDDRKANADAVKNLPTTESVTLYADAERVLLVAANGDDFVHAQLPHGRSLSDEPATVAVNPKFLIDAFNAGFTTIRMQDEFRPVKLCSADGDFALIMPMRGGPGKSVCSHIAKLTAKEVVERPKPEAVKPNPQPKDPKPMTVNHPTTNNKAETADDRDPLEALLDRTTAIREDVRECFQNLREVQVLAKQAIKERKAERKDVQAVQDLKEKLQKLAA